METNRLGLGLHIQLPPQQRGQSVAGLGTIWIEGKEGKQGLRLARERNGRVRLRGQELEATEKDKMMQDIKGSSHLHNNLDNPLAPSSTRCPPCTA